MMSLVTLFQSVGESLDIHAIATHITTTLAKYECLMEGREK